MIPVHFFVALLCAFGVSRGPACTCVFSGDVRTVVEIQLQRAEAVFSGSVIALRWRTVQVFPDAPGSKMMELGAVIVPERTWKGSLVDTLVVWTPDEIGMCKVPFSEGERYLVFAARGDSGTLHTNNCTGTQPLAGAEAYLRVLGAGK